MLWDRHTKRARICSETSNISPSCKSHWSRVLLCCAGTFPAPEASSWVVSLLRQPPQLENGVTASALHIQRGGGSRAACLFVACAGFLHSCPCLLICSRDVLRPHRGLLGHRIPPSSPSPELLLEQDEQREEGRSQQSEGLQKYVGVVVGQPAQPSADLLSVEALFRAWRCRTLLQRARGLPPTRRFPAAVLLHTHGARISATSSARELSHGATKAPRANPVRV